MELGGKNADMKKAIEGTTQSAFFNCGQICFCTERVFVHRSRFDEFLTRMIDVARNIVIGEPDHQGFSIGPLVSMSHRDKVLSLINTVQKDGGSFAAGSTVPAFGDARHKGAFIEPTIVTGLSPDARFNRALRVAPQIRVGHAWVNAWQIRDLNSPLTGAGISRIDAQFGRSSLEFCSQPQTITIRVFDLDPESRVIPSCCVRLRLQSLARRRSIAPGGPTQCSLPRPRFCRRKG